MHGEPGNPPLEFHEKMDDRADSMLTLFPGSAESAQAVAVLSEIGIYDDYMIRNRLRSRLPVAFAPCRRSEMAGETGRRLAEAGVRFLAVSKQYLDTPFAAFDVVRCRFDQELVRVWDEEEKEQILYDRDRFLVLEAVYDSVKRRVPEVSGRLAADAATRSVFQSGAEPGAGAGERAGVFLLFSKNAPLPVRFMEEAVDYSFLGSRRGLTAAENFRKLGQMLSERFGTVCRDMVTYAFGIQAVTEDLPESAGGRGKKKRQVRMRSNVASVHTVARLYVCRWWQEQGWADRVFPP